MGWPCSKAPLKLKGEQSLNHDGAGRGTPTPSPATFSSIAGWQLPSPRAGQELRPLAPERTLFHLTTSPLQSPHPRCPVQRPQPSRHAYSLLQGLLLLLQLFQLPLQFSDLSDVCGGLREEEEPRPLSSRGWEAERGEPHGREDMLADPRQGPICPSPPQNTVTPALARRLASNMSPDSRQVVPFSSAFYLSRGADLRHNRCVVCWVTAGSQKRKGGQWEGRGHQLLWGPQWEA